jgi:hypothetical protein
MNKNVKVWLVLAILVAVVLLAALWAAIHVPIRPIRNLGGAPGIVPGDIGLYYFIETIISTFNITLLIVLLITYIDIYKKTKSEFTIGLIIFSMVMLLNALASNPLLHWTFGFRAYGLGPFAMLPDLFTCVALITLLYLSIKY